MGNTISTTGDMQQWFVEQKQCDLIIEVTIPDGETISDHPSSSMVVDDHAAAEGGGGEEPSRKRKLVAKDKIVEIKAHRVVLGSKSQYFNACITKGFREGVDMRVKISLENDQELEDFRLLLKLTYASKYVKDGDVMLDKTTLIRLASLANAFEFHAAVRGCMEAVADNLSFKEATCCTSFLPYNLQGEDIQGEMIKKAIQVLVKGLDDPVLLGMEDDVPAREALLKEGVDALATYLGPVADLFVPLPVTSEWLKFEQVLVVKDAIKELSANVFERLLQSDVLQVQCENEAYALLLSWLYHSVEAKASGAQIHFERLYPHIRYPHLTVDYLINVILCCPLMIQSNKFRSVMIEAMRLKSIPEEGRVVQHEQFPVVPRDRAAEGKREWEIRLEVKLIDYLGMQRGDRRHHFCGPVFGYPLVMSILRGNGQDDNFHIGWELRMPVGDENMDLGGGVLGERRVGAFFSFQIGDGGDRVGGTSLCSDSKWIALDNYYDKPWEEVVYQGSPYFPQGKTYVKAFFDDRIPAYAETAKKVMMIKKKKEGGNEEEKDGEDQGEDLLFFP